MRFVVIAVGLGLAGCTCQSMPEVDGGVGGGDAMGGGPAGGGAAGGTSLARQPTWPVDSELSVSTVTSSTATLNWPEATDDVGVTEYVLTRNGAEVARGLSRAFAATGLVVGDFAAFRVVARDADGNESDALRAFVSGARDVEVPTSDVSISTDF